MIKNNFLKVIKLIHKLLDNRGINWMIIGSANLQIQGIDVNPRDLDIIVHYNELKEVTEILSEFNPSEIRKMETVTNIPTWESHVIIDNIEVQIMGEIDSGLYMSRMIAKEIVKIRLDDIEVPCLRLDSEAETYSIIGREDKSKLILEFLNRV